MHAVCVGVWFATLVNPAAFLGILRFVPAMPLGRRMPYGRS